MMKLRYKIANAVFLSLVFSVTALAIVISCTANCEAAPAIAADAERMNAVVYRRYVLSEVPDAIRYSEEGRARGKIIVDRRSGAGGVATTDD